MYNRTLLCGAAAVCLLTSCNRSSVDAHQLVERGMLQVQNEQLHDALNLYEKALEIDPRCDDAWLQLALLYDDFLNDKSNAVVAYAKYIEVSGNEATKQRVSRWLAAAESEIGAAPQSPTTNAPHTSREMAKALEQRERQFKLLRTELINRYEGELEELRQELMNAQERVVTLETENTMFRGLDPNGDVADLLDRIASNEQIIAVLQMEIEQCMTEADEVYRGKASLQSLVTNLQTELRDARAGTQHAGALAASNAILVAECDLQRNRLRAVEQQRNELQLEVKALADEAARAPAVAELVVTTEVPASAAATVVTQVSGGAALELAEALAHATNDVLELQNLVDSHAAERDNYVGILESLKQVVSERDRQVADLRAELAALTEVQASGIELQQVQALLEQEQEARARNDKLLYERTVQYKRLVQSYEALRSRYADEIEQRRRLSEYLARVQREIGGPAGRRSVAAGVAPSPSGRPQPRQTTPTAPVPQVRTAPPDTPRRVSTSTEVQPLSIEPLAVPIEGRFYIVQPGDSLIKIARAFYGDPDKWTLVYNANRDILDRPNALRVGQKLEMP